MPRVHKVSQFGRDFGARLRVARAALGVNQREAAEKAGGFKVDVWSRIERGDSFSIPMGMLGGIVQWLMACGINLDWLLTGEGKMTLEPLRLDRPVSPEELRGLLAGGAALPAAGIRVPFTADQEARLAEKIKAIRAGNAVPSASAPAQEAEPAAPVFRPVRVVQPGFREVSPDELGEAIDFDRYVPILTRIAAGAGCDTTEAEAHPPGVADAYVEYHGAPRGAFALRVSGDSMMPTYLSGDLIVVNPNDQVREGVAVVVYEDERGERLARLKRLRAGRNSMILESLNPAFPPVEIAGKRLIRCCRVIAHLPRILEEGSR